MPSILSSDQISPSSLMVHDDQSGSGELNVVVGWDEVQVTS